MSTHHAGLTSRCALLAHSAPSHSDLILSSAVPKKLLQEPGPSAPVDPLSPSAHDPNVVGDSAPPQGTVVKPSDTVPGEHNPLSVGGANVGGSKLLFFKGGGDIIYYGDAHYYNPLNTV